MIVAEVGTTVVAAITAVTAGLVLAGHLLAAFDRTRKSRRTDARVAEVHELVNDRLDRALEKIESLQGELAEFKRELG